ncbi:copper resistance CopC/CopD family protein [Actinomadura sp. HBU206391]|uniref:copper resistance CopC/CopD family protein n=1 Tax=Actinomadura sp. HBU206391 TaxID=2731692 RepID=UPI00164EED4B|nr:copper resistance protein CopC [Actinomadura sp. HBU206391]MBC6459933.1 copper resistance protein CopC/CopD [Actinomadura sp. HBU206391]
MTDKFHPARRSDHRGPALRILLIAAFVVSGLAVELTFGAMFRPAYAHAELLESSPVDNAVADSPPRQAWLRFNEAVTLTPQSIQLLDSSGDRVEIGAPEHAAGKANTAAAALPAGLRRGTYTVAWRVLSADSHVISGAFRFSVGEPSVSVASTERGTGAVTPTVHAVGRGLAFLGLALALGGAVLLGVVWPAGVRERRGRLIVWAGFAALGLGTVVVFLAQGPYTTGEALTTVFDPGVLRLTFGTRIGQALLARLEIAFALAVVFAIVVRRRGRGDTGAGAAARGTPVPAAVLVVGAMCCVALVSTWPLTDHAHIGPQAWLAVPVTGLHLLAISLWLGGLVTLTACVVGPAAGRSERVPLLEPALPRFSGLAQVCFTVIAATGLYLSWRQVGTLGALVGTEYGRLLLVKFGVVLVIVALAAQGRRFVRRHGRRSGETVPAAALRRLRRSVAAEVILGVGALSLTTVLVNTAPARTAYAPPVRAKVAIPATARTNTGLDGGRVEVELTPAKQGPNVADIYLVAKDDSLVNVPEISGRLESGDKNIGSLPVKLSAAEPGHYVASAISIPYPGPWTLRLDIRTSEFNEVPVHFSFTAR